jgi:Family of unknown function (DUF695)/Regulator of ribonuclease activity B
MVKIFLLACLFFITNSLWAQQENWDVYIAKYNKRPASIMLDMGLQPVAPVSSLPFLIITGVTFKQCSADGLPEKIAFDSLYKISDAVQNVIKTTSTYKLAGTFTHNCERMDYYYVSDTTGVRSKLISLYKNSFKTFACKVNIKMDKEWNNYLKFLYPNETTREYMGNSKVIEKLKQAGDQLIQPRQVNHFCYFNTQVDKNCYLQFLKQAGFKIDAATYLKEREQPYKIEFSRTDKVDIDAMNKLTITLRKQALLCNGNYDGWETFVVK